MLLLSLKYFVLLSTFLLNLINYCNRQISYFLQANFCHSQFLTDLIRIIAFYFLDNLLFKIIPFSVLGTNTTQKCPLHLQLILMMRATSPEIFLSEIRLLTVLHLNLEKFSKNYSFQTLSNFCTNSFKSISMDTFICCCTPCKPRYRRLVDAIYPR